MNGQRKQYHSIPLRAQARIRATADDVMVQPRQTRPAQPPRLQVPKQSFASRQQMPAMPDEDQQYTLPTVMPRSAVRYRHTDEAGNEVFQQGNKRMVVTYGKPPKRFHWLLFVGVGMLATILLWVGLSSFGNWWGNHQLDSQYGNPRTWQTDEVVGHSDSTSHPTHFIFENLHGRVVIIELPGGDITHARIYSGPQILGDNVASLPVTGEFKDTNGDGKVDMLVHVGTQTIVYLNTGTQFQPQQ